MRGLKGKTAIVTGAASGIGKAISGRLGEEGCKVCILDLNGDGAEATAADIQVAGGTAFAYRTDITDRDNVVDSVEKAEKEVPDLILMDLSLPKLDGWGATKALKKNEKTQHIPIIALSAHAMQEHKESALQAGCNDYDTKPVDFARLLSKIEEQLAKVN